MDDGRSTTLSSHKNDINEIWRRRHRTHFLEVVDGHVGITIRSLIKIIVKSISILPTVSEDDEFDEWVFKGYDVHSAYYTCITC
jgi:hypothetical protein